MRIETVYLRGFPPFANTQLTFPAADALGKGELHLLVGQNGTGKTRLLCLLAAALGNRSELDARTSNDQSVNCVVVCRFGEIYGVWGTATNRCWWSGGSDLAELTQKLIEGLLQEKVVPGPGFFRTPVIGIQGFRDASPSLLYPERRPKDAGGGTALAFRGTGRVSDAEIAAVNPVKVGEQPEWLSFDHLAGTDLVIGQSMANIKMGAAMESMSAPSGQPGRAMKIAIRLEAAISQITGRSFYFVVDPTPKVSLKVYWGGVPMMLKQLPDGLRSIIAWLVSCVAKMSAIHPDHEDPLSLPLILLLDEPESHLHPAWQRKVIPAAQAMFPQAQMFVATHSPFVISSANEGWIHVLRADEATGVVTIEQPKPCSKGDTWIDAVEDVLGITEWYDPETEELLKQFRELREAALSGTPDDGRKVQELASTIATRSHSLSDLMGRELRQLERQLAQKGASA